MRMTALSLPFAALAFVACSTTPPPPPVPDTVVRVDTLVVSREVPPPLPEGREARLCLGSGQSIAIHVSPAGDTLIGPRRVTLAELGPGVGFVGSYAAGEAWFVNDAAITFDRRSYSKFGQAVSRECDEIRIVGDHQGVNLFADRTAAAPFETIFVPVRPGVFQLYRTQVGQVRG